jgi:uncharacterized protein (TIGR00290 family)
MKVVVSWSGGKDCLLALRAALADPGLEVVRLVTTVGKAYDRVSMHGVRRSLLLRQFESIRLPGHIVTIPAAPAVVATAPASGGFMDFPPNDTYVPAVKNALVDLKAQGIEGVVYGDIFLEDLKQWRDDLLASLGLRGVYPIWKRDSRELLRQFVNDCFRATIVCINNDLLDDSWAGREVGDVLTDSTYPAALDPCGENGEYHSFVYDGPLFAMPVEFEHGETVRRGTFTFHDLTN